LFKSLVVRVSWSSFCFEDDDGDVDEEDELEVELDEDSVVGESDDSDGKFRMAADCAELFEFESVFSKLFLRESILEIDFFRDILFELVSDIELESLLFDVIELDEDEFNKVVVGVFKLVVGVAVNVDGDGLNEDDSDVEEEELVLVESMNLDGWRFFSNVFCNTSSLHCKSLIKFLDSFNFYVEKKNWN